ncbi:MAG: hypothetical protein AABX01_07690 [Candidatus Micrarchaeota archaeon]
MVEKMVEAFRKAGWKTALDGRDAHFSVESIINGDMTEANKQSLRIQRMAHDFLEGFHNRIGPTHQEIRSSISPARGGKWNLLTTVLIRYNLSK